MSFMVTVRERQDVQSGMMTSGGPVMVMTKKRWVVLERFEAKTAKEGLDRAFKLLANNPECSVTVMRKR